MKRKDIKKRPLSDTVIDNLEAEAKQYTEKDSGNLYLAVKPTGAKSWIMRYKKANGKWTWHGLGSYPILSGAKARLKYHEKLAELANGATELNAREVSPNAKTFEAVAMEWLNEPQMKKIADSTKARYTGNLKNHILPKMGTKDIASISRQSWLKLFREIQEKINPQTGKPIIETGIRSLQIVNAIYRFAYTEEIAGVDSNPVLYLSERLEKHETSEMAHVSESELPQLLHDIDNVSTDITRLGLKLLSHLFLRPNEVINGKWSEIDFENKLWDIPAERMKKRRPHLVPLSNQVISILKELKSLTGYDDLIFPSRSTKPKDKQARYRQALIRKGYKNRQTLHGFRHIASTKLNNYTDDNNNKFDERVIEFALAHKVQGVKGSYNKADYLADRRKLNQWYSDWLDSLVIQ